MPIFGPSLAAKPVTWREKLLVQGRSCLVLLGGLLITFGLWYSSEQNFQRDTRQYFDFRVEQLLESFEKHLENYQEALYGTRGLFAASYRVERGEFHEYIAALHLDQRFPGIQGIGFSLLLPKEKMDSHTQEIRRQGFPDYRVYPTGERDFYTSIIYIEPFTGRNLKAFGYDMYSDPVRRQAMAYARDNNKIGLSGEVSLIQETDDDIQAGFLMYLPVYRNDRPHSDVQQRRTNIIGWVYSPFRIKDFVEGIRGERARDLNLTIYDGVQASAANLMFRDKAGHIAENALGTTRQLFIGGHSWELVIHSEPSLKDRLNHNPSQFILIGGMTFSLLLALLNWQFIARNQALALAAATNRELKESEARFHLMADSAPVLIWVADSDHSAIWFNKYWLDFTGRTLEQEIGRGWLESVYPAHAELLVKLLIWHYHLRKPFSVEFRLRRHDGKFRWIVDAGVPRFNEKGEFVGFIGSCIDITERKEMEEELWELATTDGLTGFLNRRHFLVRLQEEFGRTQRNAEFRCAVLMLDLDYFKRINDSYGHAAGDAVLKHFAEIIRSQQRKIDVVGRVGGEEFAIILPDTDASEARAFAERLRKMVADRALQYQTTHIEMTVSIGIALLSSVSESAEGVLRNADRALYEAKESGRNRVALSQAEQ